MGFPEVVACCADTVVIVRDTDFSFGGYHSFSRKEIHNPASGNGFNLVWQQVAQGGRGWHRHGTPIDQTAQSLALNSYI